MAVLPDFSIRRLAREGYMIRPFAENRLRKKKISFGASCYGYDFRLADQYKIPQLKGLDCLDPKQARMLAFEDFCGSSCLVPPNSYILARSLEHFRIPRDILVICTGKSTYARCGLIVNVTPLEPEWEGFITISLINGAPVPVRVHSGEGIGQAIFLRAESPCHISYPDRKGKYQGQKSIQPPRL